MVQKVVKHLLESKKHRIRVAGTVPRVREPLNVLGCFLIL
jgi:hypothetical protein